MNISWLFWILVIYSWMIFGGKNNNFYQKIHLEIQNRQKNGAVLKVLFRQPHENHVFNNIFLLIQLDR